MQMKGLLGLEYGIYESVNFRGHFTKRNRDSGLGM